MTESFVDTNPADSAPPPTELRTEDDEQPDPSQIEVVSVTEEDLPRVETPNTLNVSPLGSLGAVEEPEKDFHKPTELPPQTSPPSPGMPITKVQPFIHEDDLDKSWRTRLLAHRVELMALCLVALIILIICIGLGVGLSCVGRFRCGSSSQCFSFSVQCDGVTHCGNGEDELGCVRLSGKSSVLQVQRRGQWSSVCSENWNKILSLSACKQLGYSRFESSLFVAVTSIEEDLRSSLVSFNFSQSDIVKLQSAQTYRVRLQAAAQHSHCRRQQLQTGSVPLAGQPPLQERAPVWRLHHHVPLDPHGGTLRVRLQRHLPVDGARGADGAAPRQRPVPGRAEHRAPRSIQGHCSGLRHRADQTGPAAGVQRLGAAHLSAKLRRGV